jgi:hypothetical protein
MPEFTDAMGRKWQLNFDGLTLGDLVDSHKINLAEISGGDYVRIKNDNSLMTKALCVLFADQMRERQISAKQLASSLNGTWDDAWTAVWSAAKLFFSPTQWSDLELSFAKSMKVSEMTNQMNSATQAAKFLSLIDQMPPDMKEAAWDEARRMMAADDGDGLNSADEDTVISPDADPISSVSNSQAKSESIPAV